MTAKKEKRARERKQDENKEKNEGNKFMSMDKKKGSAFIHLLPGNHIGNLLGL